jgi:DNA-directed RNA polymerase II subunit RPB2
MSIHKDLPWKILNNYFSSSKYFISKHHLDSYDEFIDKNIKKTIASMNPFVVTKYHTFDKKPRLIHKIEVFVGGEDNSKIYFTQPLQTNNDVTSVLFPNEARLRNQTYASELRADMLIKYHSYSYNGGDIDETIEEKQIKDVMLSKIPIMLHSKLCILRNQPFDVLREMGECPYDQGGYFVINGKEKVIIAQERNVTNKLFINKSSDPRYHYSAFVRCTSEKKSVFPKTIYMHVFSKETAKTDREQIVESSTKILPEGTRENAIVVTLPHVNAKIPLFLLFRALGVESDRMILEYILQDLDDPSNKSQLDFLHASIIDANYIFTQEQSIEYINRFTNFGETAEDTLYILTKHLFPNIDGEFIEKALYLGYLVNQVVKVAVGITKETDRDNYMLKRVGISGVLLSDIFKDFYNDFRVKTRSKIDNMYEFNGWNSKQNISGMIIHENKQEIFGMSAHLIHGLVKSLRGSWGINGDTSDQGIVQDLSRISYMGFISHLRRVNMPMDTSIKIREPHRLTGSQWGVMCPCESPDGASIGLLKNLAILCHITYQVDSDIIIEAMGRVNEFFVNIQQVDLLSKRKLVKIRLNNNWIGCTDNPNVVVRYFKLLRRNGLINIFTSICWNIVEYDINILTDHGRCCRPLFICHNGQLLASNLKEISKKDWSYLLTGSLVKTEDFDLYHSTFIDPFELTGKILLEDVMNVLEDNQGVIEYLDVEETNSSYIAMKISQIERLNTHCEIHPSTIFSVYTSTIPLPNHNQAPRNIFSGAQGKQAIGVYATNFNNRIDTMSYVLHYPQQPLIATRYHKYLKANDLPNGENLIVAIMTYTGYNQEDSIIINKSAVERGLFNLTYFKSYVTAESEVVDSNKRATERIYFANPNKVISEGSDLKLKVYANYTKLDDNGMPKLNSYIDEDDAIVGKVYENISFVSENNNGDIFAEDKRTVTLEPRNEIGDKITTGFVDKIIMFKNTDGFNEAKIRLRNMRTPELGDKLASRHGQKGVIGMMLPHDMMPFTQDGLVPDIIVNPHAFPSRMTIGHLIECLLAKAGAVSGMGIDATAFEDQNFEEMMDVLQNKYKMNRHGDEIMYSGINGEQMASDVFIGPTYYFRLKHMVADKINYRRDGKIVNITKQPTKGRGNDGGLRIGEMETNVLLSHGISSFMKESMMERSDKHKIKLDEETGQITYVNKKKGIIPSDVSNVKNVEMPYAFKLFVQEMQTMSIDAKLFIDPDPTIMEEGQDWSCELGTNDEKEEMYAI